MRKLFIALLLALGITLGSTGVANAAPGPVPVTVTAISVGAYDMNYWWLMSTDTTPEVKPPANRTKLILIVVGALVVVLLAIIAISISSQAIRANEEASAKASAEASAASMLKALDEAQKVIDDQRAKDAKDANFVCERRLLEKLPTATVQAGKTTSTYRTSDGSYDTKGGYTDASKGNTIPMQFVCSSIKAGDDSWNVFLKSTGH
jgi:hypothetical protein